MKPRHSLSANKDQASRREICQSSGHIGNQILKEFDIDAYASAEVPDNKIMSPEALFAPIDPSSVTIDELHLRARTLLATYGTGIYPPDDERDLLTAIAAILAQRNC